MPDIIGIELFLKVNGMVKLDVYISKDCWNCLETERIVAEMSGEFPDVDISLLDLHHSERPPYVFAAPTYVLNGQVVSLGNPSRAELSARLIAARNDP